MFRRIISIQWVNTHSNESSIKSTQKSFGCFDQIIVRVDISGGSRSGVVGGAGSGGHASRRRHAPHKRPDFLEVCLVRRSPAVIVPVFRFMLLEMPVEIGLLSEATVAVTTPKRSLLVVDISYVSLQVRRYWERAFAVFTAVRLFARVGAQVAGQVGTAREGFAAVGAGVTIPRADGARVLRDGWSSRRARRQQGGRRRWEERVASERRRKS